MSLLRLWKELVITQTCTASISLLASLTIVAFISSNGLSNPYRRLIFGLSVADICQSFAIAAGPWLIPSDVPQALWGIGNMGSCRLDGILFLVGMTAAPMYTLSLCIYYVCKLKCKMTDDWFAHKVEKKIHAIIILTNSALHFTALGMNTINPAVNGGLCLVAATPTGCRQNPEIFGECDRRIEGVSQIFTFISTVTIPIVCLIGDILCLATIFWHVLAREKIFGTMQNSADNDIAPHSTTAGLVIRNRHLQRPIMESYDFTSDPEVDGDSSLLEISEVDDDSSLLEINQCIPPGSPKNLNEDLECQDKNDSGLSPISFVCEEIATNGGRSEAQSSNVPSDNRRVTTHTLERDPDYLSRLYKKELLIQACCYVLTFCVTSMPFLMLTLILIGGALPSRIIMRTNVFLYPLAGLFNIIVYTRPNVASLRRACPKCSRLQAFWLVLKAGGEKPYESDLSETYLWSFGCTCLGREKFGHAMLENENMPDRINPEQEEFSATPPPVENANLNRQDTISDLRIGVASRPLVTSSLPPSNAGVNGMSMSLESNDPAHRAEEQWNHVRGRGPMVDSVSRGAKVFEAMGSYSNLSNNDTTSKQENEKEEGDIWAVAFERARNLRYSE